MHLLRSKSTDGFFQKTRKSIIVGTPCHINSVSTHVVRYSDSISLLVNESRHDLPFHGNEKGSIFHFAVRENILFRVKTQTSANNTHNSVNIIRALRYIFEKWYFRVGCRPINRIEFREIFVRHSLYGSW